MLIEYLSGPLCCVPSILGPHKIKILTQLMNWYVKDKFRGFEDSHRLRDALTLFSRFKQRLDKRDINQYANINELEDAVEPWELELTKKEKRQQGEYHIDENRRWGTNRWSSGTVNDDHTHKLVDVESADGSADMDNGVNRGDELSLIHI